MEDHPPLVFAIVLPKRAGRADRRRVFEQLAGMLEESDKAQAERPTSCATRSTDRSRALGTNSPCCRAPYRVFTTALRSHACLGTTQKLTGCGRAVGHHSSRLPLLFKQRVEQHPKRRAHSKRAQQKRHSRWSQDRLRNAHLLRRIPPSNAHMSQCADLHWERCRTPILRDDGRTPSGSTSDNPNKRGALRVFRSPARLARRSHPARAPLGRYA